DPTKGILYDGTTLRVPANSFSFFIAASDFVTAYSALTASDKTKVNATLAILGIDLTDGLGLLDLIAIGDNGVVLDGLIVRDPSVTLTLYREVQNFKSAYDAYVTAHPTDKTTIDNALAALGINLDDGSISKTDLTNMAKKGVVLDQNN